MRSIYSTVFLCFLIPSTIALGQTDFYSKRWSRVYKYEVKALPKSALRVVDSIYSKAKSDKNVPQLTKALIYQSKFSLTLSENAELAIVNKFKNEIAQAKPPLKNILESLLANIYWEYFQENRWKYYDRTRTDKKEGDDFRLWDGARMIGEIHRLYQSSLLESKQLQQISLVTINDILTIAENSKTYRPTLFDFIIHNALEFYQSSENYLAIGASDFVMNDPRLFSDFENLSITTDDSSSLAFRTLELFQSLLSFHKNDKDPSAYVSNEIERLEFVAGRGSFENGLELHKKALEKLKSVFQQHPASALIDFQVASLFFREGSEFKPKNETQNQFKKKAALELLEKTIATFPNSDGAAQCRILRDEIKRRSLELMAEEYIPIHKPSRLLVTYTNIDSLSFFAYPITEGFMYSLNDLRSDSTLLTRLLSLTPEAKWKAALPTVGDYQEHTTEIIVPQMEGGMHLIVASTSGKLHHSSMFAYTSIQVTNLALIQTTTESRNRYQVVDRNTGTPVSGVKVNLNNLRAHGNDTINHTFTTDRNGFFELKRNRNGHYNIVAHVYHDGDNPHFGDYELYQSYQEAENEEDLTAKAFLFSDRSIYRPGQPVFFKGILIKTKGKKSSTVVGQYVEVILEDVNGKEVDSLRLKTNSYGSFSGEFKLPANGLTGQYTISVEEDDKDESKFYDKLDDFYDSRLDISVEEYKRPTFEVTFKPIKETFKLNDTIQVHGAAATLSGAKVSGSKVNYRVKRNVRFPNWGYRNRRHSYSRELEVTHGEATTDSNGEFLLKFKSIPDEKIAKEEFPVFEYEISADVTDVNGETRTSTSVVKVGYHSMTASIGAQAKVNRRVSENTLTISTENLNAQAVSAKGIVRIYKSKSPNRPQRSRPWAAPDMQQISEDQFINLFPNDPYTDDNDQSPKGKLIKELTFDTGISNGVKYKVDNTWELGSYYIELSTSDEAGNPITARHHFELFDPSNKSVPDNNVLVVESDKAVYSVGDIAKIKVGSASKDISVVIDVERNNEIAKTFIKHLTGNSTEIQIPIIEGDKEGLQIHYGAANYNAFFHNTLLIAVNRKDSKLEIETISFKDKLQPGAKETWSFEIKSDDPQKKEAEVLASMYDASLDQFKSHQWDFDPTPERHNYGSPTVSFYESFHTTNFTIGNGGYRYYEKPRLYFDEFDNFGFSITGNYRVKWSYLSRIHSEATLASHSKVSYSNDKNQKKGYVSGRITDDDGVAISGVNVLIKGTTVGTVTDADGRYIVPADKGDQVVFSFIGYSTIESKVGKKNVLNVTLAMDVKQLSEVVVTALGVETTQRSLALAVTTVMADSTGVGEVVFSEPVMERVSDSGSENFLHGKIAGVQITGMPGGARKLLLRGAASLATQNPLYVVDGVVTESSKIDKDDLESVQVLRGDAATSLYGSQAANGVIIIITKSGQKKLDEELAKVNARKNFNETAFFFPHLTTDENGRIQFNFTTPESLTRWKLQLLAHNRDVEYGLKTLTTVTQKEFMITPNAPRFLRTGDEINFSAKLINLTGNELKGNAALQLTNAVTGESIDLLFQNTIKTKAFKASAKGNSQIVWKLKVPAGIGAIQYRVVAKAGNFSDGEQNALPVLSKRMLVTETLPISIRSDETKTFVLEKLRDNSSNTLQHHQLTLEVTTNPAWYAVQALPYLMEFPHECSEQTFARYYANTLGGYVANSNPKIKQVFDKWASSGTLISNLEKNAELKSMVIQESPWLRDAQSETEQRKRIAILFDLNAMNDQRQVALDKLEQLQLSDGGFTWFAGGHHSSRYITQHIASGFAHLRSLKVVNDKDPFIPILTKAIKYLDDQIVEDYKQVQDQSKSIKQNTKSAQEGARLAQEHLDRQHVGNLQLQYLYMRSFFPGIKIPDSAVTAVDYYRKQAARYWTNFKLYFKGMNALIQYRNQNEQLAREIIRSLKENSITSEEMGMYWKENVAGWHWSEAPIETQALLIEAFAEVQSSDPSFTSKEKLRMIDDLRVWLLKNKQTNQWQTTKATTEAIYALLINGSDWLTLNDKVEISVGGKKVAVNSQSTEVGTGYFKTTWKGNAITPEMSKVKMAKKGEGIAWAALYWQYLEDLDKITAAETPLKLSKKVFLVQRTDKGDQLTSIDPNVSVSVGSLLRVRIELRADRDMEFLHMKDMRAAGLEPVDVLSEYKWQDGLGYYQSVKDASTNFFFDSISKGAYVFEYDLRVNQTGNFSNGITTIQSMYAPEFSSHSEGIRIKFE